MPTVPMAGVPRLTPQQVAYDLLRQETLGEYEILGELGRGGMATVYLAHDIALDRKVAIKVLTTGLVDDGLAERFRREARTAASLNHPHVIPIYAVRERYPLLYFAMKYIPGQTLDPILKTFGPFPIPMAQLILSQAASALGYAHRRGVIHRDVKPANIMLDEEGWVVVTDFGIAKVSTATGITMTGVTVGTPSYMSPEQCMGLEVTGASDQYSLGVVAYEMIAGQKPFQATTAMAMMYAHLNDAPISLSELRPDCPADLADNIMRMLSKDPEERLPSIDEAFGTPPLSRDDPTRQQLVALAQSGANTAVTAALSTPTSPIPPARRPLGQAPRSPTPTPRPAGARPLSGGAPPASAAAPATARRGIEALAEPDVSVPADRPSATGTITSTAPAQLRSRRRVWLGWAVGVLSVGLLGIVLSRGGAPRRSAAPAADTAVGVVKQPPGVTAAPAPPPDSALPPPATAAPSPADGKDEPTAVERVELSPARATLEAGRSVRLGTRLFGAARRPIKEPRAVEWASSAPEVAAVDQDGTVRALAAGRATVTATVEGKAARAVIDVRPASAPVRSVGPAAVATVVVTPASESIPVGGTLTLAARLLDAGGKPLEGKEVTWTANSRAVAVFPNGDLQALAPGTVLVTATSEGRSGSATVTVVPVPVATVSLGGAPSAAMQPGDVVHLTVTARDAKGAPLTDRSATWETSDPAVASVAAGAVTARGAGTATITATVEGRSATAKVTVASPAPAPDPAAARARAEADIARQLDAFVQALNARDIARLRRAYPGMTASEETGWRRLFEQKDLKIQASLERTQPAQIQPTSAEAPFDLHLTLSAAGNPAEPRVASYRAMFDFDGTAWRLRQLVAR